MPFARAPWSMLGGPTRAKGAPSGLRMDGESVDASIPPYTVVITAHTYDIGVSALSLTSSHGTSEDPRSRTLL